MTGPFRGLSAFPITPADPSGRVDLAALRRLVRRLVDAEVDSIGLLGSTGSYPYLTALERRRALDAAIEEAGGRTPILVGIGAMRTSEAIRIAEEAEAAGAVGGLLAPVSYTPLTDDEVFGLFADVSGATGLPICIYNNPATTHFTIGNDLVRRIAELPRVGALKNLAAPPDRIVAEHQATAAVVPNDFSVGYSADAYAPEALLAGGSCWYSVAGGLFPRACNAIVRAAARGDSEETRRLTARLEPLWALFRAHSSLRVMYAAANALKLCDAAPPRPILPLSPAIQTEIGAVVRRLDLA